MRQFISGWVSRIQAYADALREWIIDQRPSIRWGLAVLAVSLVAGALWGAVWWIRYPHVPDVATADVGEAINFMGTDNFNRMTEAHRKRFAIAIANRLREKSFKDLLGVAMQGGEERKKVAENINRLKDKDEIGGAFLQVFLDKFYELAPGDREIYLTTWALAEKFGRRGDDAGAGGGPLGRGSAARPAGAAGDGKSPSDVKSRGGPPRLPTPDQLEKGMANFLAHQSPRTSAQMGELMNMMRRKRESMGIKQ